MTAMPYDREWTVGDLDAVPDDGFRYELVDGVLLVSPAPVPLHQSAAWRLLKLLNSAAPPGTRVLPSPIGYRISVTREVQPDVPSYWIVDPRQPAVTVLVDGRYAEAALVRGDEVVEAHRPSPVRVVPAGLVR